jgi:hypothetical protein
MIGLLVRKRGNFMGKELVDKLITDVSTGSMPIVVLVPRRGNDTRKVQLTGHAGGTFSGVFIDDEQNQKVTIRDEILMGNGFQVRQG